MSKAKKKLEAALAKTEQLPKDWFSNVDIAMDDLPSVRKARRVRKNIFLDEPTAEALEKFCHQKNVSFTDIANDILTAFVDKEKKRKTGS